MNCNRLSQILNTGIGLLLMAGLHVTSRAQSLPIAAHIAVAPISHVVMQGEPIVIRLRLTNDSQASIHASMSAGPERPYSMFVIQLVLKDVMGNSLPASEDYRHYVEQGLHGFNSQSIPAGKWDEGQFVATQVFAAPPPGKYRLTVHLAIPCYVDGPSWIQNYFAKKPDSVIQADDTITLTVTPSDPVRLHQIAQSLGQQALHPDFTNHHYDPMRVKEPLRALFSMPASVALPTWRALLHDPAASSLIVQDVGEEAVRLGTVTAANLLVEVVQDPDQSLDNVRTAKQKLSLLYSCAPSQVKAALRTTVLATNGSL